KSKPAPTTKLPVDMSLLTASDLKLSAVEMCKLAANLKFGLNGQPTDRPRSDALFRQAADMGDIDGLGQVYDWGIGCEVDTKKAFDYSLRGAAEGRPQSMCRAAWIYDNGENGVVSKDTTKGAALY